MSAVGIVLRPRGADGGEQLATEHIAKPAPLGLIVLLRSREGEEDTIRGRRKRKLNEQERAAEIAKLEKEMKEASKMLEFEYAAVLRDRIIELRGEK